MFSLVGCILCLLFGLLSRFILLDALIVFLLTESILCSLYFGASAIIKVVHQLTAHLFGVAKNGIRDETGLIRGQFTFEAEDPREVVDVNHEESQRQGKHDHVSVLSAWLALKVVKGNAEGQHIKDINQSSGYRVQELPVLAFLGLVHELDAQIELNLFSKFLY